MLKYITAYKVNNPDDKEFPNNNSTLWRSWQLELISKYLPSYSWDDEFSFVGLCDKDDIKNLIKSIKRDMDEILEELREIYPELTLDDIKQLCDWLQVCVKKNYAIYIK